MNPQPEHQPAAKEERPERQPYEKPWIQRVDLAMAETLGGGCKADIGCTGPPITIRDEVGS